MFFLLIYIVCSTIGFRPLPLCFNTFITFFNWFYKSLQYVTYHSFTSLTVILHPFLLLSSVAPSVTYIYVSIQYTCVYTMKPRPIRLHVIVDARLMRTGYGGHSLCEATSSQSRKRVRPRHRFSTHKNGNWVCGIFHKTKINTTMTIRLHWHIYYAAYA